MTITILEAKKADIAAILSMQQNLASEGQYGAMGTRLSGGVEPPQPWIGSSLAI